LTLFTRLRYFVAHPNPRVSGDTVPRKANKPIDFEKALKELESLVETMEKGELSLEDSLKSFERGVELTRQCQQALSAAEQKVKILLARDADAEPVPFDRED